MLKTGTVVEEEGGWRVIRLLGKGTCCEVYKVHRIAKPHIKCALKIYREGANFENAHDVESVLLDLVCRANGLCKYLVSSVCSLDWEERPCLVQELLDLDLRQILTVSPGNKLSLCLVHRLAQDILRGLVHLHKSGFVHGDVKPNNLLWCPSEFCLKIIDFGLSFHLQDQYIGQLQSSGYRAPEVEQWNASVFPSANASQHNSDKPYLPLADPYLGYPASTSTPPVTASEPCSPETSSGDSGAQYLPCQSSLKPDMAAGVGKKTKTFLLPVELTTKPSRKPGKAADLWSLGCILVEMITGEKLFSAQKLHSILHRRWKGISLDHCIRLAVDEAFTHVTQQQQSPGPTDPALNLLKDLVTKLLEVDASKRLSAEDVLSHSFFHQSILPSFLDLCVLPGSVLRLLNIVEDTDLEKDNYQGFCEDITEECRSYGALSACVVPTDGSGRGKVYLAYTDWEDARQAYSKLAHRHYNSHSIVLSYFPTQDFLCQNYY